MTKNLIFSGIQPTGALHLGNYLGAIKQWTELQREHESMFCIVDYHALTVEYDPKRLPGRISELALDLLACGIDPDKATLFVQSHVPEHTELGWIFNTITPMAELERMTQYKDKSSQHKENINAGLFTYPVLQAADVLLYKANLVPVGEDQVQHVELMRVITRKFNKVFGTLFPEPKPLLTKQARVMSLSDPTKKMSKSLGDKHYIALSDSDEAIKKKVRSAVTDTKGGSESPGVTNLFVILEALSGGDIIKELKSRHKKGSLQYSKLKDMAASAIIKHLSPIRARRAELEKKRERVGEILIAGAERAQKIAQQTMREVREKIGVR